MNSSNTQFSFEWNKISCTFIEWISYHHNWIKFETYISFLFVSCHFLIRVCVFHVLSVCSSIEKFQFAITDHSWFWEKIRIFSGLKIHCVVLKANRRVLVIGAWWKVLRWVVGLKIRLKIAWRIHWMTGAYQKNWIHIPWRVIVSWIHRFKFNSYSLLSTFKIYAVLFDWVSIEFRLNFLWISIEFRLLPKMSLNVDKFWKTNFNLKKWLGCASE